jgi:hypothetical protein
MKPFWQAIGKAAVKVALYALEHPDEVAKVAKVVATVAK